MALASALNLAAQDLGGIPDGYVALMRSGIKTKKVEIVRQNLTLSEDQAGKFWPLHRSYENDLSKLNDDRFNLIKEYAAAWENLSEPTARDLGRRLLDFQKKRVDLRRKYFDRMSKEISPTVAAKFFQVELQLESLLDLEVASVVPLVK
ncbi:MAG: hypothetical protein SFV18_19280 [Bryobacteraceae bacterium]|nr:hypothetical protein [Bryobacteraceae bacterium]